MLADGSEDAELAERAAVGASAGAPCSPAAIAGVEDAVFAEAIHRSGAYHRRKFQARTCIGLSFEEVKVLLAAAMAGIRSSRSAPSVWNLD